MIANIAIFKLILIPIISSFIGWMTNWIAIKMLFHPRKPIDCYFFVLQGVFYKKQKKIAQNLASTIEERLFSLKDITEAISDPHFIAGIKDVFADYIENFVKHKLSSLHPMLAMIPEDMINKIKSKLIDEFEKFIPSILNFAEKGLEERLDIKKLIREKIESFDVAQLEEILTSIMKSELKHIEYIGGVLGFIIGLTQLAIIHLI